MTRDAIKNEYFEWLSGFVCDGRFSEKISYRKLMMFLHNTEFRYSIARDENRAHDGIDLRYRFTICHEQYSEKETLQALDGPCSVLEMIIGLAIRCEENIMDDPRYGNRTGQWFWRMMTNLGLGNMTDDRFDKAVANDIIQRFLDRKYAPNGKGGLFTLQHYPKDLRKVEIWYQMCWYLDGIV